MKGFGAFYDYVCARFKGYRLAERRLDLLSDAVLVKNRHVLTIQFHDITAIGGYQVHIVMDLLIYISVIDLDTLKFGIENVPNLAHGTTFFLIDEGGRGTGLLHFGNGIFPSF